MWFKTVDGSASGCPATLRDADCGEAPGPVWLTNQPGLLKVMFLYNETALSIRNNEGKHILPLMMQLLTHYKSVSNRSLYREEVRWTGQTIQRILMIRFVGYHMKNDANFFLLY